MIFIKLLCIKFRVIFMCICISTRRVWEREGEKCFVIESWGGGLCNLIMFRLLCNLFIWKDLHNLILSKSLMKVGLALLYYFFMILFMLNISLLKQQFQQEVWIITTWMCRRNGSKENVTNPGNNLYVTGLSTRVTEKELEEHFAGEGKVGINLSLRTCDS